MCGAREAPLFLLKSFELWFRAIRAGLSGMSSDAACCWGCLSLPLMLLTFCLIPLFWASDGMGAVFDMPACPVGDAAYDYGGPRRSTKCAIFSSRPPRSASRSSPPSRSGCRAAS